MKLYDVFICHASEDKETFVRPLAEALIKENIEVWYDEFSLELGDSLRKSIDKGLSKSRFGIVVYSFNFFNKEWPQYELDGLIGKEFAEHETVLLPIWHNVSKKDVESFSYPLAGRVAIKSSEGMEKVVKKIFEKIHPDGSPLLIARDILIGKGMDPPVVTDPYWLEVAENSFKTHSDPIYFGGVENWGRWRLSFPIKGEGMEAWGEELAWTAMQLNWISEADSIPVTILTHPKRVLKFIRANPGLKEACLAFPEELAEFAPQLTIPSFGEEFEAIFEERFSLSTQQLSRATDKYRSKYLCDEEWMLRHKYFAGYTPQKVVYSYFYPEMFGLRKEYEGHDRIHYILWLLSSESDWLPNHIKDTLIEGMKIYHIGFWKENWDAPFEKAIYRCRSSEKFKWSKKVVQECLEKIIQVTHELDLPETPEFLFEKFRKLGFVQGYIATKNRNASDARGF